MDVSQSKSMLSLCSVIDFYCLCWCCNCFHFLRVGHARLLCVVGVDRGGCSAGVMLIMALTGANGANRAVKTLLFPPAASGVALSPLVDNAGHNKQADVVSSGSPLTMNGSCASVHPERSRRANGERSDGSARSRRRLTPSRLKRRQKRKPPPPDRKSLASLGRWVHSAAWQRRPAGSNKKKRTHS